MRHPGRAFVTGVLAIATVGSSIAAGCGRRSEPAGSRPPAAHADAGRPTPVDAAVASTASGLPASTTAASAPAPAPSWTPTVLTAKGLPAEAAFGEAVDADGGRIVVGAPGQLFAEGVVGSAHLFERVRGSWKRTARLTPSQAHRGFGAAVAIDGDRIAVGGHDGQVVIFERTGVAWREAATIVLPMESHAQFSAALDLDGDTLVVGLDDWSRGEALDAGEVVVYQRSSTGGWELQATLTASDAQARADRKEQPHFGSRVALRGDRLAVAARQAGCDGGVDMCGALYLFARTADGWREEATLPRAPLARWTSLGSSIAIDGTSLAVMVGGQRRAWMLTRDAAGWADTGTTNLPASSGSTPGSSEVAVHGARAAVSEYGLPASGRPPVLPGTNQIDTAALGALRATRGGTIHVYARQPDGWAHQATIRWPDDAPGSELGSSLAMTDDVIVAGAPKAAGAVGAVVVFTARPAP